MNFMIQSMRVMCREYTEIAPDKKILYFPFVGFEWAIWIVYVGGMDDMFRVCEVGGGVYSALLTILKYVREVSACMAAYTTANRAKLASMDRMSSGLSFISA